MSSRSRTTELRILAGAVGVGALVAAVAGIRHRRSTRGLTLSSDVEPNALLKTPTLKADISELTTDDGAIINVRAYGPVDGDPIVLSHGWTCSTEFWYPQVNALAGEYRVITYDQRGHGRSTVGNLPLGPDVLADDLSAVLAATVREDKKAVIVGHSMGGMSIIAWAGRHPDEVKKYASAVMLASTASERLIAETTVIPLPNRFPRVPVPVGRAILSSPVPFVSSGAMTKAIQYVSMSPNATKAEIQFCENIVRECKPRIRGGWGAALSTLDIHEGLDNLEVPTTVLVGSLDRLTPPVHARKLAQVLDDAGNLERLIVLPGVGHMSSIENIDEFDKEIVRLRNL
ncbi:alpha/beta fold hydrolase [Rhodococcus erythropolis]|uniref:alpha/beta fold hydrolase n=1 Tax=Rhodococcus erythropolis TaxID=1833 RepID=UPI0002D63279|nr:alpha/beta hydrolase [Rhodococcus erythropolis]